jgi:hypothetical protein
MAGYRPFFPFSPSMQTADVSQWGPSRAYLWVSTQQHPDAGSVFVVPAEHAAKALARWADGLPDDLTCRLVDAVEAQQLAGQAYADWAHTEAWQCNPHGDPVRDTLAASEWLWKERAR